MEYIRLDGRHESIVGDFSAADARRVHLLTLYYIIESEGRSNRVSLIGAC